MNIRQIAAIAKVSPATVSLVLNNKKGVGPETRTRVKKIIEDYNYNSGLNREPLNREPLNRVLFLKYQTHGMAVEENQGFIASIIDHIESECRRYSYEFLMYNCESETFKETIDNINDKKADAVILLGTELEPENFELLKLVEIPLIVIDNSMEGQNIDSIVMANEEIVANAIQYLYELGHEKIGYFKTNIQISNLNERYDGYLRQIKKLGLEVQEPILVSPTLNGSYSDMIELIDKHNFSRTCSAYFADNDSIAIGISKALQEKGFIVPFDVSIIGTDDIPYSEFTTPPLTTMRVSREAIGILTLDIIHRRIKCPDWPAMHVKIMGSLIKRDSTCSFKQSTR